MLAFEIRSGHHEVLRRLQKEIREWPRHLAQAAPPELQQAQGTLHRFRLARANANLATGEALPVFGIQPRAPHAPAREGCPFQKERPNQGDERGKLQAAVVPIDTSESFRALGLPDGPLVLVPVVQRLS